MSSAIATRQNTPAAESISEPRRIMHCVAGPTTIVLEDGVVLMLQAIPGRVVKRLDKFDPQGLPSYDVDVQLRVARVPAVEEKASAPN